MYLVVEWHTMSIPQSSGRCSTGVAKVPSQTVMMLGAAARASCAMAARSVIFISGFEGVSTQISRVFGRRAARTAGEVGHVHIAGFQAPLAEDLADHLAQAPVDVVRREDVVARFQPLDQRGGHRQAGREDQSLLAALEVGQALLQRRGGWDCPRANS